MVAMLAVVAAVIIALLVGVSVRLTQRNLAAIEEHHRAALSTKAQMLAENHALALKGLVADNAFGDIQRLIERAVMGDRDVVYGLVVSSEGKVLAFAAPGSSRDVPDPRSHVQIGLRADQLDVTERTIREADLFGEHVFEIALPVNDGTDRLGTIRYGLSEGRMQAALRAAREASQHDIFSSLALSLGVAISAAAIMALVSGRAATRIAKPITDLASAAGALAAGDRSVRVDIRSNDEVQDLGEAFNNMVGELKSSYDSLEDLNRNLEAKVESRTHELAARNRDMRLVLDNVEEGFLTLATDGTMAMEHSSILDRWFGPYGENTTFTAYLERSSPMFSAYFEVGWEAVLEGFLPLEVCVDQLPKRIEVRGSTWNVRYTPIMNSGKLDGLLVVIQDVTIQLAREKEEQVQREILQAFQRLMRDRSGFMAFHAEMTELVMAATDGRHERDLPMLRRVIHTIKGNAAMFGLERLAVLCHGIEDEMAETRDLPTESSLDELHIAWQVLTDAIVPVSEASNNQTLQVPREDVQALVVSLDKIPAARHLARQVESWKLEPVQVPLRRLAEQATDLAKRYGKGPIAVDVQAEMIRCDPKRWAPFWSDVVHVVRNAVDHGLETPAERQAAGKPRGSIRLRAAWEGSDLVVAIGDNGRGIPFDKVRERATRLGLPHATHEDLVAALFVDGVSTASEVTDLSGRGVGMAVVRNRVESMGGRVIVDSTPGVGTTWMFRFRRQELADSWTPQAVRSTNGGSPG
jgi:two-component system, chemotaxis family, sensor kinase CheA